MEGWQLKTSRRSRRRGHKHPNISKATSQPVPPDEISTKKQNAIINRIENLQSQLLDHLIVNKVVTTLKTQWRDCPTSKESSDARKVVCYGLGSFCTSTNAIYQLAYALAIQTKLDAEFGLDWSMQVFDPIMNESDRAIASFFHVETLSSKQSKQREASKFTLFVMPHCGRKLYEDVIASNLVCTLGNTYIIGNSFNAYNDRLIRSKDRDACLLLPLLQHLIEVDLACEITKEEEDYVQLEAAFNDLSLHYFEAEKAVDAMKDEKVLFGLEQYKSTSEEDGEVFEASSSEKER